MRRAPGLLPIAIATWCIVALSFAGGAMIARQVSETRCRAYMGADVSDPEQSSAGYDILPIQGGLRSPPSL